MTGNGNANKDQVLYMVRSLLSIDESVQIRLDASDALAVGLCHAQRGRIPESNGSKSWAAFIRENPDRIREG